MNVADMLTPEMLTNLGAYGIIIAVLLLQQRNHDARWDKVRSEETARREADRAEHMEKWRLMIQQATAQSDGVVAMAKEQYERTTRVLERHADVLEMQAHQMTILSQKIENNQFCPIVRKETHG